MLRRAFLKSLIAAAVSVAALYGESFLPAEVATEEPELLCPWKNWTADYQSICRDDMVVQHTRA